MQGLRKAASLSALACSLMLSSSAAAQEPDNARAPGPFAAGNPRLSLTAGTAWSSANTYIVLGVGVGYFFVNGLEVGFDYEAWVAGSPTLQRLSPELRYVFYFVPTVKPYIGTFYRHTFVSSGFIDFDQLGVRGGIYFVPQSGHVYGGGGLVYERVLDCSPFVIVNCDSVYPEVFIGFTF
jgi:opacity protein-like surface antigen